VAHITLCASLSAVALLAAGLARAADAPSSPSTGTQPAPAASYGVPLAEILGFQLLLNQYDRHVLDAEVYGSNFDSIKRNLRSHWVYDSDPFSVNQFLHPYAGSMYHGFARSAGLNYWQSLGYTMLGSFVWEIAGETDPPSINDQFTTGVAGTFVGEPLFRMANLLLEHGAGKASLWRKLGAGLISPSTALNRVAFGDRFDAVFDSSDPALYSGAELGANLNATVHSNANVAALGGTVIPQSYRRGEVVADYTLAYGLPGKEGYSYARPFDYFQFQFRAASSNIFENVMSRGLLYGSEYGGDRYRGIWGLYGTYDYIAPQIFRISTTAAALGTTGQWWLSQNTALQGTALAGVGYGSAGTIHGAGDRDYHSGISYHALVGSRLIFSERAALDVEVRDYYVSGHHSEDPGGSENIARAVAGLTVRLAGAHGVIVKYTASRRDARYPTLPDTRQTVGAISLGYIYLGSSGLGAVDWRH
jgi:hypothetical protein